MRSAKVYFKDVEAGILTQHDDATFTFQYHSAWIEDISKPSISLTLPKTRQAYHSQFLFPFFYNMLPEGSNKQVVCKYNKIDQNDYFSLLTTTTKHDSIGAVRVVSSQNQ